MFFGISVGAEQFLLLAVQFFGHFQQDRNDELAAPTAAQIGQPRIFDTEEFPVLCARLECQLCLFFECRNFQRRAKCGLAEADRHAKDKVVFLSTEELMLLNPYDNMQVATRAIIGSRLTFSGHTDGLAVSDTRWDFYAQLNLFGLSSITSTGATFVAVVLARAIAGGAG